MLLVLVILLLLPPNAASFRDVTFLGFVRAGVRRLHQLSDNTFSHPSRHIWTWIIQYIVDFVTVRYRFSLCRYFFSTYRNFQSFILLEVLIPVGVRALNWKQIQGVSFMNKPDWPRDIFAWFSTFNAECYLGFSIQSLVKIGFGHDIQCFISQIYVTHYRLQNTSKSLEIVQNS